MNKYTFEVSIVLRIIAAAILGLYVLQLYSTTDLIQATALSVAFILIVASVVVSIKNHRKT